MASTRLLGPPAIRDLRPPADPPAASGEVSHPFLDLLDNCFNSPGCAVEVGKTRTENNSATYGSSGNRCMDFFFQVVPGTPQERTRVLLAAAWAHDALTALKLVCHLRGVRGTGKSDKERFYTAALWMHAHHPKTLACNVAALAEFGYLKDFPELLFRLIHGAGASAKARAKWLEAKEIREAAAAVKKRRSRFRRSAAAKRKRGEDRLSPVPPPAPPKPLLSDFVDAQLATHFANRKKPKAVARKKPEVEKKPVDAMEVDKKSDDVMEEDKKPEKKVITRKVRKVMKLAVQAVETYNDDSDYRFLYDRIAEFFADLLASDVEQLRRGKVHKIGLAAKWCPTPGSSFDRTTLLCEAIARRLFPRDSLPEYAALSEEHYAYRVLHRLRREVLVPLREVLELPEVYMSAQRWYELPYARVASVAMRRYKDLFKKHDKFRFSSYLADVDAGKAKIAAGALLPHEIATSVLSGQDDVSELQWRRMVDDLRKKGTLRNCIAVCDVSGSMHGTPMEVCIALGVLTSDLSEDPWKGRVITFSARPQIHLIEGTDLASKLSFVEQIECGMNTNFQAVFDRILSTAVDARLPPEKMIRAVFVFSDMEFDQASANPWKTDYEAIQTKFREAGYGDVVPQMVFWNLRDSRSTPVTSSQPGVALVSGFSKNIFKMFLDKDGVVNPEAVMAAAIAGEEYDNLEVFD